MSAELKVTEGDWWYDQGDCAIKYCLPEGHGNRWDQDDNGERNIVDLRGAMGGLDTRADAHLLAASKKLYEALEAAREWVESCSRSDRARNDLTKIDHALAAARGETP